MTFPEIVEAYKSGKLTQDDILWIDNDCTFIYTDNGLDTDDDDYEDYKVFDLHPGVLLEEVLDYLGIPHSGV